MKVFTIGEIVAAVGGKLLTGRSADEVRGFSIDSRTIEPGNMFFPTIGARSDGHDFIGQVLSKGCRALAVSDLEKLPAEIPPEVSVIEVADTLKALQELSRYYLNTLPLKYKVGVTGSVGKTSTRDMTYYAAATKYRTGRNKMNYNSAYGLPLAILDLEPDTEVAVLEMGMDAPGEIKLLADIVRPDIAIITEISEVNLEAMGNLENIFRAKMEITTFFDESSTLIVNSSCPLLKKERVKGAYSLVTVARREDEEREKEKAHAAGEAKGAAADYEVGSLTDMGDAGIKYTIYHKNKSYEVELPTAGGHNAVNATLAVAAAELMGIAPEEAIGGLGAARLTGKRLKVDVKNGIKVIDDSYNACEASLKSALNTLAATDGRRRVAILGDVVGLAQQSAQIHLAVGRYAAEKDVDLLIAIGEEARYYAEGARPLMGEERVYYFPEKKEFIAVMDSLLKEGDTVLLKASHSMELSEIAEELLKDKQ